MSFSISPAFGSILMFLIVFFAIMGMSYLQGFTEDQMLLFARILLFIYYLLRLALNLVLDVDYSRMCRTATRQHFGRGAFSARYADGKFHISGGDSRDHSERTQDYFKQTRLARKWSNRFIWAYVIILILLLVVQ